MAIGVKVGTAIGAAFDNIAIGSVIGSLWVQQLQRFELKEGMDV